MEVRPGYRQTEVGVIPEDWEVRTVGEIAEVKTGPFGSALHERDYVEEGTPIITVEHLGEHGVLHSQLPQVSDADAVRLRAYGLRQGDIVFSRVGSVDRNALIRGAEEGWLFSGRLLRVRPVQELVHAPYLSYHFHSEAFRQRVRDVAVGQTMASINTRILTGVKAVLPRRRAEQEAIAEVLGDADAFIQSAEQLLGKKRRLKQGAMQELLTGRSRLSGFRGEWELARLGDSASFSKGRGLPKSALDPFGGRPCIHYGELFTQYPAVICEIMSRTDSCGDSPCSVANDVLMPTSDVTPNGLATASCVRTGGVILGGDILVIRIDPGRVLGPFLSYAIRRARAQILQLVTGITVFHLYAKDMQEFVFPMPSMAEQAAIVTVLEDMDAEIAGLEAKLAKTRRLKQGMMQELLSGRTQLT